VNPRRLSENSDCGEGKLFCSRSLYSRTAS